MAEALFCRVGDSQIWCVTMTYDPMELPASEAFPGEKDISREPEGIWKSPRALSLWFIPTPATEAFREGWTHHQMSVFNLRREYTLCLLLLAIVVFARLYIHFSPGTHLRENVTSEASPRTFIPSGYVSPFKLDVLQDARAMDRQGKFGEAIESYQKVLAQDDSDYRVNFELANVFMKLKRFKEAKTFFRRSVKLNPRFEDAYSNLASATFSLGQVEEAAELLEQAVRLNPDFAVGYNNLAFIYLRSNRSDKAIENYRKAIALDPSLKSAQKGLNEALAAQLRGK